MAQNPQQYKAFPYLLNPQGTIAIIDSDIIVTRCLKTILRSAEQGKICVFSDPENYRWFSEWEQIFDLLSKPRHQTYVNSGFVAFSTLHHPKLLEQWWYACEKTFSHLTYQEGAPNESPVAQSDQDALNAILMTKYFLADLEIQLFEEEVFGTFSKVKILNQDRLVCQHLNCAPVLLHACAKPKPWERKVWQINIRQNAYVRLLRRLIASSDVALRIHAYPLPMWLSPGVGSSLITAMFTELNSFQQGIRQRLSLRTKLSRLLSSFK